MGTYFAQCGGENVK